MYFENVLSKCQCNFRKGDSARQCQVSTIKRLQDTLNKGS